jgi:hypothetical protein
MKHIVTAKLGLTLLAISLLSGCATQAKYDYAEFRASRPASILVLPPVNSSPDVNATYSMLSQATVPLAESGYYVLPVTLVDETFRQNGIDSPTDIQQLPLAKLREIFGADAALYVNIKQYGTTYAVIVSETRVTAEAKLVDLRTGKTLWTGSATASSNEGNNNSGGGLVGLLVQAVISQIVDSLSNRGHAIAGITSQRLLAAGRPNGILFGPRSPYYLKEGVPTP